ncbi:hypothetical protein ACTZJS_26500 (plasmid) [Escherichia coli]
MRILIRVCEALSNEQSEAVEESQRQAQDDNPGKMYHSQSVNI